MGAQNLDSSEIIPSLPQEIAIACLMRVSSTLHSNLYTVCRSWKNLLQSSEFNQERKRSGFVDQLSCLIQTLPQDQGKHPVYGVTVYNFKLSSWERLPPIPDHHEGLPLFCQCVSVRENLVLLGGWNPATWEAEKSVNVFSFWTGRWRRASNMLNVRSFFACGALGNLVLVAGGHDESKNALNTAEVYNLESDEWRPLPSMSQERDECRGAVLDGRFFAISGYAANSQGQFVRSAEVFDPSTGLWSMAEDMWPMGSCPSVVIPLDAQHLLALHKNELLRYDLKANVWSIIDSIPRAIQVAPCATGLSGRGIFITGATPSATGVYSFYMYRFKEGWDGRGEWVEVETEHEFANLAQAACTVEN